MKSRERLFVLCLSALATACASHAQTMYVPTEAEVQACEAQGGTIEPAHAIDAYVCLLPPAPTP